MIRGIAFAFAFSAPFYVLLWLALRVALVLLALALIALVAAPFFHAASVAGQVGRSQHYAQ